MEFLIGLVMIGTPIILISLLVWYMINKALNHKDGITRANYPIVNVGGKKKRVHPNSFLAQQARKKGQL